MKENAIKELQSISPTSGLCVSISENKRSLPQNALWHKWVGIIADHCGYSFDDMKASIKDSVLGKKEYVNALTGEVCYCDHETRKLTVKQFSELMEATQMLAGKLEISLPSPDYYGLEQ